MKRFEIQFDTCLNLEQFWPQEAGDRSPTLEKKLFVFNKL
jgi:hypothetical protein